MKLAALVSLALLASASPTLNKTATPRREFDPLAHGFQSQAAPVAPRGSGSGIGEGSPCPSPAPLWVCSGAMLYQCAAGQDSTSTYRFSGWGCTSPGLPYCDVCEGGTPLCWNTPGPHTCL